MSEKETQENVVELADKKSLNFFRRIQYSIFKLDKYNVFLDEKIRTSIKYLAILLVIVTVIIITLGMVNTYRMINKVADFVKGDCPNFTYSHGVLNAESIKEFEDKGLNLHIIVDTTDVSKDKLSEYEKSIDNITYGFLLLSDKFIVSNNGTSLDFKYDEILGSQAEGFNKEKAIELIAKDNLWKVVMAVYFISLFSTFINIFLVTLVNICMVFLIGYIIALLIRLPIKASGIFNISVYSFTLSILLNLVYSLVYYFARFSISNFDTIYMVVAYIYIIAAILILKQNLINTDKVVQVEREVKIEDLRKQEELEEKKSEEELDKLEKEKKEQKKKRQGKRGLKSKDSLEEKEPDGSEI